MAERPGPRSGTAVDRLLGTAPPIAALRDQIQQLARFDAPGRPAAPTVLLQGETGTGKSLVARVVHDNGPRAAGPWVALNCATLPETMLEAELFGFEAGAFTDARRAKPGLFEAASGGTLFLDEIDALPLALQGKLLTALESKRVRRLGAMTDRVVDVKIIAATNADLAQAVADGRLRTDLYHRLAVVVLTLPPLRERGSDVVLLAHAGLQALGEAHGLPLKTLTPDAETWLQQYAWPGNVRELHHLLERVMLLHPEPALTAAVLKQWTEPAAVLSAEVQAPPPEASLPQEGPSPERPALPAEALQLRQALQQTAGNVVRAARLLGLSRDQVRTRMRRYGLTRQQLFGLPPTGDALLPEPPLPASGPELESGSLPAPSFSITPERRQLTVVCCELVDSALLASRGDPEASQEVLQVYYAQVTQVITAHGGVLAQTLGPTLLCYFGYPQAYEDAAVRAVRAALAVAAAAPQWLQFRGLEPLHVRLGVHTGPVVIGPVSVGARREALALGETPQLATQLAATAHSGTVVCSASTARLTTGYVTLEELGSLSAAALPAMPPRYRVLGETGVSSRLELSDAHGLTPFVGRETELALLRERWTQVRERHGQVVLVRGEAGIGKSRLVRLMQEEIGPGALHMVWQGAATQQHSPLAPVIASLQRLCDWQRDTQPEARLQRLERLLTASALPLTEAVPLLAALLALPLSGSYPALALSPPEQKRRTVALLIRWLLAQATRRPVLLVVEDLHWIDPSSLDVIDALMDHVPGAALYVLGTCRPEFSDPWPTRTYCTHVSLGRLASSDVLAMMRVISGEHTLPPTLMQGVARQADGVPLFVEELTKMVLESPRPTAETEPDLRGRPVPPLAIPATLQDSLLARLDRLGSAKTVAQIGAVIGREFPYSLIQPIVPQAESVLQDDLARLVRAELLYQVGVPPEVIYRFKHALVQEAAAQSLVTRARQQYHREIAEALLGRFPDTVAMQPEVLAQHYTEGGLAEPAARYWLKAGQRANERSAHVEAQRHLRQGLAALQTLPETPARAQQELDMQIALGAALMATEGVGAPGTEQPYARARELCAQVGETPQLFQVLWGLSRFYQSRGELGTARELGEQLARLAERTGTPTQRLQAHESLGHTFLNLGEYTTARMHLEQGIDLSSHTTQPDPTRYNFEPPEARCLSEVGKTLWCLGYPTQALRRIEEGLALAQRLGSPYGLASPHHQAAGVYHRCRQVAAVEKHGEALIALATTHGFPLFLAFGSCWRGWAVAMHGQSDAGLALLRQGLAVVVASAHHLTRPHCLLLLAEALGHAGQVDEGLSLLAEASTALKDAGRSDLLAEAYRLQGLFLLRQPIPAPAPAEACFQEALTIARGQRAKSWELRAATSLAQLWRQQGKIVQARAVLAPVYGWFEEGFDTADLQDAQRLLASLDQPSG